VKFRIITVIPVFNGEAFIRQTLESVARQTLPPDRVIVLDNCSTDRTEEIVKTFTALRCEFIRHPAHLGLFENFNCCLEFAPQTEFLQILHADDTLEPEFYQTLTGVLQDCPGRGLAWCLDRRIDENNRFLSLSGRADGKTERLTRDEFLKRKAEIRNQAFCATLLKTNFRPSPCRFPLDFPILGDMIFWAAFGAHCEKIVHVRRALANYRWHGGNETTFRAPTLQALVLDEWRTMQTNEALRSRKTGFLRNAKLKGLFAVRSGIKAKRVRQNGNVVYAREIAQAARRITGWPLWTAGKILLELRDVYLFGILRRRRHPKNIYG